MTFERTYNTAEIKAVMTHASIYPFITDDAAPAPEDFEPYVHSVLWYVRVLDGRELLGLFLLVPANSCTWDVHTCLLPSAWGTRGQTAAKELIAWFFETMPGAARLCTAVPAHNRLALKFAERAGMTEYGRNPLSYRRNGALQDQILLGISKPCQQQV